MVAFLLIITAAGLVLAGYLTETIELSIGAGVIALVAVSLVAGRVLADRRQRQRQAASARAVDEEGEAPDQPPTDDEGSAAADRSEVAVDRSEAAVELVRVITGRKRFHEPGCSSLADRESEELTREEAEEEGFTPCSLCATSVIKAAGS